MRWLALVPLFSVGCHKDLPPNELLGKAILFDVKLSSASNQSCATCHGGEVGGTGPDETLNRAGAVYEGSIAGRFGNRKPPATNYAPLAPILDIGSDGKIRGGNFWDGRATGWLLGSAAANQAQGPFLNPLEQALPDGHEVVVRVCASSYGGQFRKIYGELSCQDTKRGYDNVARAVAAYEGSVELARFSSKYDAFLGGRGTLSDVEQRGLGLFEGKAHCNKCHPSRLGPNGEPPMFTDFTFDNLGVPVNPDNPFLADHTFVDEGLGGFLHSLGSSDSWRTQPFVPGAFKRLSGEQLARMADENRGRMRVPTLRNVDKRPRPNFVKAYTHNGWFKSLSALVHFYNTRDVLRVCPAQLTSAEAATQNCWPAPESAATVNHDEIGALGLTADEEASIVAFLATLTDR